MLEDEPGIIIIKKIAIDKRISEVLLDSVVLTVIWCLAILVVNPSGDFPINDDFFYWIDVKRVLDEGGYRPTGFESATLVTHILWGSLFGKLFGLSYEVLRLSTLLAAHIGALIFYLLLRKLNKSRALAMLCAFIIEFNPVLFSLSFSFMSDVTASTLMILSIFSFICYLDSESKISLAMAAVFSVMATLCRQTTLAVPLAFFLSTVFIGGYERGRWRYAGVPLLLGGMAYVGFSFWVSLQSQEEFYGHFEKNLLVTLASPKVALANLANNALVLSLYAGAFMFPLAVLFIWSEAKDIVSSKRFAGWAGVVLWLTVATLIEGRLMPMVGNYVNTDGIGPLFLISLEQAPRTPELPFWLWMSCTVSAVVSAGALIMLGEKNIAALKVEDNCGCYKRRISGFLIVGSVISVLPLLITWFFDRYLIQFFILCFLFLAVGLDESRVSKVGWVVGSTLVALICMFSVVCTHDFLSMNRARWSALNELMLRGITPSEVEGGYEFNGSYLLEDYKRYEAKIWGNGDGGDPYMVAFSLIPGYEIFNEQEFDQWFPLGKRKVFVLKKL